MKEVLDFDGHRPLLNPDMFKIIFGLRSPMTIIDISTKFNIPKSTIYHHFDYLKKLKFIEKVDFVRYKSKTYRKRARYVSRVTNVEITKEGIIIEYF